MFGCRPFPIPHSPSPSTARPLLSMFRSLGRARCQCHLQARALPRERRVIWDFGIDSHQPQERPEKALGLAQREMEYEAKCQRGLDRQVGELGLRTSTPIRLSCLSVHGLGRQPDGHVPSLDEAQLVRAPVAHEVSRLVLRVDAWLHALRLPDRALPDSPAGSGRPLDVVSCSNATLRSGRRRVVRPPCSPDVLHKCGSPDRTSHRVCCDMTLDP